ncbi:ApbE family lipoprotein [Desulfosudis oleivorans Hxd3]|uniref:FAD:protein FMN transferase n=2 Tax=Desulfosudis TaxID=2904716 RepID=A9A0B7_DESOH|nr:ApbE family lipoprotein [Desulfosudis oleivorans Hxd3]
MMRRLTKYSGRWMLAAACLCLAFAGCDGSRHKTFSGKTMGTEYHVTVVTGMLSRTAPLQKKVEARLAHINAGMSTYMDTSEISRFNNEIGQDQPFAVSKDFLRVAAEGMALFRLTDGAWDGSVWPLMILWGFDRPEQQRFVPDSAEIDQVLTCVGYDSLQIDEANRLVKKTPCLFLDFASIAKGYGVDVVAEVLREAGVDNFIVEVGGEVYAAGVRETGDPWRIGINTPEPGAPVDRVRQVVALSDRAMATSGDYRNYFVIDDRTYSHVLDPRTGYPVANGVVSATVVADTCTFADGLATALMVMGAEPGTALVNTLENVESCITVRRTDGTYEDFWSTGFVAQ